MKNEIKITIKNALQPNANNRQKNNLVLAYISDLHLDRKLHDNGISEFDEVKMRNYFSKIINKMYRSVPSEENLDRKIVFVGDVSYNFSVFKLFFETYRDLIFDDTFVVLGNHELWNTPMVSNVISVDDSIATYRSFLSSLSPSVTLLENELWFPNEENHIFSQNKILSLNKNDINKLFDRNNYAIFGGIGFAGNNPTFNQTKGIYMQAKITREEEKNRSKMTNEIHQRLKKIAFDKHIFYVTHMPMSDWSKSSPVPKWIYLHGHTHQNYCYSSDEKQIYANNQIGYSNIPFSLKYIIDTRLIDLNFWKDGIHEISCKDYIAINKKLNILVSFNRDYNKMFMVKREGFFLFFVILPDNDSLKMLCGGQIRNVKHNLQYYYDNICNYTNNVIKLFTPYFSYQEKIAEEIKVLGGEGLIHGGIIDIDYYNHVFVNPFDATVIPYFATAIDKKYVYSSTTYLLEQKRPDLYGKYCKLLKDSSNFPVLSTIVPKEMNKDIIYVEDTSMYAVSLKIKNIKYLIKNHVVREWNDEILAKTTGNVPLLLTSNNSDENFE